MKKIAFLFALICIQSFSARAQSIGSSTKSRGDSDEQCISQGKMLIDVYYGFPNLYAVALRSLVNSTTAGRASGLSVSGFGPVGGKFEYLLTEQFGMSAEFNYSVVKLTYSEPYNNSNGNNGTYNYTWTSPAWRAMLGFNFHFVNTSKMDVYAAVKTGYYRRTFLFSSDQPGYYYNYTVPSLVPVAFRVEVGMRYFFTNMIGLHVNIGLGGGPIIAGGLSVKI